VFVFPEIIPPLLAAFVIQILMGLFVPVLVLPTPLCVPSLVVLALIIPPLVISADVRKEKRANIVKGFLLRSPWTNTQAKIVWASLTSIGFSKKANVSTPDTIRASPKACY
jgi:hypothetical protein